MIFTETNRVVTETQHYRNDAEITMARARPLYRGSSTDWRPDRITVHWSRDRVNGRDWGPWHGTGTISGPKLLRNGADSPTQRYTDRYLSTVDGNEAAVWLAHLRPGDELPAPDAPRQRITVGPPPTDPAAG